MPSNYILETDRLILRPCVPNDLEVYEEIFCDPEMMQHFDDCKPKTTIEAKDWLDSFIIFYRRNGWGAGMLVRKSDEEVVGLGIMTFMLHDPESDEGDLIYLIRKSHWGQGYATEFAQAAIEFMFKKTPIKRVIATAMPENKASNRVLEKTGMDFSEYNAERNRNIYIAVAE